MRWGAKYWVKVIFYAQNQISAFHQIMRWFSCLKSANILTINECMLTGYRTSDTKHSLLVLVIQPSGNLLQKCCTPKMCFFNSKKAFFLYWSCGLVSTTSVLLVTFLMIRNNDLGLFHCKTQNCVCHGLRPHNYVAMFKNIFKNTYCFKSCARCTILHDFGFMIFPTFFGVVARWPGGISHIMAQREIILYYQNYHWHPATYSGTSKDYIYTKFDLAS